MWYSGSVGSVNLSLAEITGSILTGDFRRSFLYLKIYPKQNSKWIDFTFYNSL